MKKLSVVVLLAAAFIIIFPSCEKVVGEGPLVTQTRTVGNFTGVSSEMSGTGQFCHCPGVQSRNNSAAEYS